tara:strand:- start:69919 stop:72168 length:2250 start_codon:yes stop_codon:yes gene_type:complete
MVLEMFLGSSRRLMPLVLALLSVGCLKAKPTQRLQKETPIAVAIVHDKGSALGAVPGALQSRVQEILAERNLLQVAIAQASFESEFLKKRATRDRFESVAQLSGNAQITLLVETRAQYYSQLNGRYRWTVYVKLSLAKAGAVIPDSETSFTVPVLLSYDHQREKEALAYAANTIANKLGKEVDTFIAGLDLATVTQAKTTRATSEVGPMYFVMLDRFHNGRSDNDGEIDASDSQAFHGGDITGLIAKLDHIAAMGFKTVWLSPVFSMRTQKVGEHGAFHGYWTEDLRESEQRFGSTDELLALRAALDKRGMNLVLDMVLNHVGYETKLVSEHPDWFHHNGDIKEWEDPVQMTTFDVHGLPDLAQENDAVYSFLLSASAHWIEVLQPAGFRLDAVKHVGNEFWRQYTADLKELAGEDFATIGELYNGDPKVLAEGFTDGGFSHLFDFPLYFSMNDTFCKGEHLGRLASTLSLDSLYADANRLVTFADNHDVPRVWSACNGDALRVRALLTFLLTARGIPTVNYGTEIGLAGAGEPENRQDMDFAATAQFAPLIRKLLHARKTHEVLRDGRGRPLHLAKDRFLYLREGREESALIAINLSEASWTPEFPQAKSAPGIDLLDVSSANDPAVDAHSVRVRIFKNSDLAPSPDGEAIREISIAAAAAEAGELRLVGAGPRLGDWEPSRGVLGKSRADGTTIFTLAMPVNEIGVYKFVRTAEGTQQWEDGGNRYLFAKSASADVLRPMFSTGDAK